MTKMAKWTALILVGLCAAAFVTAIVPAAATAQGAEEEYDLDLPGSGGDETTPATNAPVDTSNSEDDGGFPVLAIVLFAVAGVGVGIALWRLRTRQAYERSDPDEPPGG